jgi:hypothetical protein
VDILRIKFRQCLERINSRPPDGALLVGNQNLEPLKSAPVCEMRAVVAKNSPKRSSRYKFDDRLFSHQFTPLCSVKALQEPVLMQMFDRAAVRVNVAHQIPWPGPISSAVLALKSVAPSHSKDAADM